MVPSPGQRSGNHESNSATTPPVACPASCSLSNWAHTRIPRVSSASNGERRRSEARRQQDRFLRLDPASLPGAGTATAAASPPHPRGRARPRRSLELRALLAAVGEDRLSPLWRVAVATGCRRGEVVGIRWIDSTTRRAKGGVKPRRRRLRGLRPPLRRRARPSDLPAAADRGVRRLRRRRACTVHIVSARLCHSSPSVYAHVLPRSDERGRQSSGVATGALQRRWRNQLNPARQAGLSRRAGSRRRRSPRPSRRRTRSGSSRRGCRRSTAPGCSPAAGGGRAAPCP